MKKTTKKLLSLLLAVVMVLGLLPTVAFAATAGPETKVTTAPGSDVQISKEVTDNKDGTYKITMEAYVTGSVKPSEAEPLDIVLVLDQSGSMAYDFAGNTTSNNNSRRQYAMKQAVNSFIEKVGENSSNHRMALVTFGSSAGTLKGWTTTDSAGVSALKGEINELSNTPSGATKVDMGMTQAKTLLDSVRSEARKIVIVFTDGVPTASNEFDTGVADKALAAAKAMKDAGATIYTVGIFGGADPSQLYGKTGFDTNSDGTAGSEWLEKEWGFFPGADFPKVDVPAGNRFLNYLSSNYPNVTTIGLTPIDKSQWVVIGFVNTKGWKISDVSAQRNSSDYYLVASDAGSLTGVFTQIAESIAASVEAGEDTVLADTLTDYFSFNYSGSAVTDASVKVEEASGTEATPTWTSDDSISTLAPTFSGSTVSVTGFDYSANPVVKDSNGWRGKKLIVSFDIVPNPQATWVAGTENYPTNDTTDSKAGLYLGEETLCVLDNSPEVAITTYKVSYEFDGTAPESVDPPGDAYYLPGAAVTVAGGYPDVTVKDSTNTYVIETWHFDAWKTADEIAVNEGVFIMPDEDVTITGAWTKTDAKKYTVTYEFEGTVPESAILPGSESHFAGENVEVAADPTAEGWDFNGWTTADGIAVNEGVFTMPSNSVSFTGTWTQNPPPVPEYTPVTIDILIQKTVEQGGNVTPPDATFTFEIADQDHKTITDSGIELVGNTIITTGAREYDKQTLTVKANTEAAYNLIKDGFYLREKNEEVEHWNYSEAEYFISKAGTPIALEGGEIVVVIEPTSDLPFNPTINTPAQEWTVPEVASFTNTYTKRDQPQIPDDPQPPVDNRTTVELIKVDANDRRTFLSGAQFNLYKVTPVGDILENDKPYTTDKNGRISVQLYPGNYYWQEVAAPRGYALDSAKHPFTVSMNGTSVAAVVVENRKSQVPDVFSPDHYAYIIGYNDGLVHPEANITRAEVATIFFRLLSDEVRNANITWTNSFSDVASDAWYNTAVSTMASMGVINGYPNGTFGPNNSITRAEFAAIAARFDPNGNKTGASFTDINGHWAKKEISIAANNGWVNGYPGGEFRPEQKITRAEAMTLVNRVLQRIPETKNDLLPGMVTWPDNMNTQMWYYLAVQEATNSHYYSRKTNGFEYWTELRANRNWAALEK